MPNIKYFKGTTTVGVVCNAGVVFSADSQAIYDYIISKNVRKIFQIEDTVGMTITGSLGDAQIIVRLVQAEIKLYKMRRQESLTIKGMAHLLAQILSSSRYFPYLTILLVGGIDKKGPSIFSLDFFGGQIQEREFVATGSGSPIAYGVLEERYQKKMSIDEGVNLAIQALHNALKRDTWSGGRIDIVKITPEGYTMLKKNEVEKKLEELAEVSQ